MKGENELLVKQKIKVAIIGGGGAVGSILISFLQKCEQVSQIICVDNNPKSTIEFIKSWDKVMLIVADVGDADDYERLVSELRNTFLIINAASSEDNITIMTLAYEIGAHYFDFASLWDHAAEQKSFQDGFLKKGISAWINWGVEPGLTNLLVAVLIRDNKLIDCEVLIWLAEQTLCSQTISLWSPGLITNEITSEVVPHSKDSNHVQFSREPFSGPADHIFPDPIGKITCYKLSSNTALTVKDMPEVKEIFMRSGGSDIDSLKELYDKNKEKLMKLRNRRPKKIKDKKHRPGKIVKPKKKPSYILPPTPTPRKIQELIKKGVLRKGEILVDVEVNGRNPETEEQVLKKASWSGLSLSKVPIGTTHISYNTALIAFCAIEQMIAAKSLKPGVYAPEEISEEDREVIIRFIEEKTNPVHFE